jgi:hypothetical protein
MAIELLVSQTPVYHKARHDIESIFFVFIYLCTNLSGPGVPRSLSELREIRSIPLASWFNPASSMQRLGSDKISSLALFEQRITPYFAEYFKDLKPCARKLLNAIYPNFRSLLHPSDIIHHDDIIQIFSDTLKDLPEIESDFATVRFAGSGRRQRKRSLGIHDNSLCFNRLMKRSRTSSRDHANPSLNSDIGIHSSTASGSKSNTSRKQE